MIKNILREYKLKVVKNTYYLVHLKVAVVTLCSLPLSQKKMRENSNSMIVTFLGILKKCKARIFACTVLCYSPLINRRQHPIA